MNRITFPLKLQMKRPDVGDLQDALQLLLERDVLLSADNGVGRQMSETLKGERNNRGQTTIIEVVTSGKQLRGKHNGTKGVWPDVF